MDITRMESAALKNTSDKQKMIFLGISFLMILVIIKFVPRLFIPFFISYLLFLVINPLLNFLQRSTTTKRWKIILVLLIVGVLLVYLLVDSILALQNEADNFETVYYKTETAIREKYFSLRSTIKHRFNYDLNSKILEQGLSLSQDALQSILTNIPSYLSYVLEWMFLVPIYLFFMLRDGIKMKKFIIGLVPNCWSERFYFLFNQFNNQFGDYLFAKFIEANIVGVLISAGLWFVGFPFAFLLGVIAGITNIIPYIGPIAGFIPAILIAFVEQYGFNDYMILLIIYLVANLIDMFVVFPLLVSKIVDLHPIVVIISIVAGSQLMGVAGMILSIPVVAFLKLVFLEFYKDVYVKR